MARPCNSVPSPSMGEGQGGGDTLSSGTTSFKKISCACPLRDLRKFQPALARVGTGKRGSAPLLARERRPKPPPPYSSVTWWAKLSPSLTVICLKPRNLAKSKKVKVVWTPSSANSGVARAIEVSIASTARAR